MAGLALFFAAAGLAAVSGLVFLRHRAAEAGLTPAQACGAQWSRCADNDALVQDSGLWPSIGTACESWANAHADGATLIWPLEPFQTYNPGRDYVSSGVAVATEHDVIRKSRYGAPVRAQARCEFDLISGTVVTVTFPENSARATSNYTARATRGRGGDRG